MMMVGVYNSRQPTDGLRVKSVGLVYGSAAAKRKMSHDGCSINTVQSVTCTTTTNTTTITYHHHLNHHHYHCACSCSLIIYSVPVFFCRFLGVSCSCLCVYISFCCVLYDGFLFEINGLLLSNTVCHYCGHSCRKYTGDRQRHQSQRRFIHVTQL